MSQDKSGFASGLVTALPIALGYFPIAFAFGVAATKAGSKAAGVVIGKTYPAPIVDHAEARDKTLARYAVVKKKAD